MTAPDEPLTDSLFGETAHGPIDPFALFEEWLAEARRHEPNDPNAMALASIDAQGMPDARMVLLNGLDRRGFVFFTNLQSAKAAQLRGNPKAALLFHWKPLRRQVRVRGIAEEVEAGEADAYFASRPRQSRIGAHASEQSRPLASRAELVARVEELTRSFEGQEVPRPAHWSGFRIVPEAFEFWKDGAFRLHDRFRFIREGEGWAVSRLYP